MPYSIAKAVYRLANLGDFIGNPSDIRNSGIDGSICCCCCCFCGSNDEDEEQDPPSDCCRKSAGCGCRCGCGGGKFTVRLLQMLAPNFSAIARLISSCNDDAEVGSHTPLVVLVVLLLLLPPPVENVAQPSWLRRSRRVLQLLLPMDSDSAEDGEMLWWWCWWVPLEPLDSWSSRLLPVTAINKYKINTGQSPWVTTVAELKRAFPMASWRGQILLAVFYLIAFCPCGLPLFQLRDFLLYAVFAEVTGKRSINIE